MKVAFVSSSLPHGDREPFILPEIAAFRRRGHEILLVPMRPQGRVFHAEARELLDDSLVAPLLSPSVCLFAAAAYLRWPGRARDVLRRVLRGSRSGRIVAKNLVLAIKGLWLADWLETYGIGHVHSYWAAGTATLAMVAAETAGIPWSFTAYRWDIAEDNLLAEKVRSACFARVCDRAGAAELAAVAGAERSPVVVHSGVALGPPAEAVPEPPDGVDLRVLVPAMFIEKKGHAHLVAALGLLRERGMRVTAGLAGDGPLEDALKRQVAAAGLGDAVRFLGILPHETVLAEMHSGNWDAVALPSVTTSSGEKEGIPISLIEAMSCSLPVVSTPAGGMPELLEGGAGLLVPERDEAALAGALERLARDRGLRGDLGRRGRDRVEAEYEVGVVVAELARRIAECTPDPA